MPAIAGIFFGAALMQVKTRVQAFGVHLLGSVIIAAAVSALVFLVWYPGPLPQATGVTHIFVLMLLVDVIVGPLITLIVFDRRKKELSRDLMVVVLLQFSALAYGIHTVFVARPAFLVFSVDRLELVYANDLTDEKLAKAKSSEFSSVSWWRPRLAAASRPDDAKVRSDIAFGALMGGDDLAQLPQYYVPYGSQKADVLRRLQPLPSLAKFNPQSPADVQQVLARHAVSPGGVGFLPVRGKVRDLTAIIATDTGEVIEIVALNPWN